MIALVGTFATAVAMLGLHRLRSIDPRAVVAHFSGFATVTLLCFLVMRGESTSPAALFDRRSVPLLLGVGLTGTIGQVLLTKAFAAGAPARISVLGLTQVLFAIVFDLLLEGRRLGPLSIAGFSLVLLPTAWITSQARQGKKHDSPQNNTEIGDLGQVDDRGPESESAGRNRISSSR